MKVYKKPPAYFLSVFNGIFQKKLEKITLATLTQKFKFIEIENFAKSKKSK